MKAPLSIAFAALLIPASVVSAGSPPIPPLTRGGDRGVSSTRPSTQPELDELTRRIISGRPAADLPTQLTRAMAEAGRRLTEGHDPGERTQDFQRQALRNLDALLEQAQRASRRSQKQSQANQQGQGSGSKSSSASAQQRQAAAANRPASEERDTGGSAAESRGHSAPPDLRRRWGELPQREREELLQGSNEQSLPRYREWVERYYRTLAEPRRAASATQPEDAP